MNDEVSPPPSAEQTPPVNKPDPRPLPFHTWIPFVAGTLTGIVGRLIFSGKAGDEFATMMVTFLLFSPLLVGMVTVYVAERQQRRTWGYYVWASVISNILYILGTMIIAYEGLICAILISPLFVVIGAVGGLLMGVICRIKKWPKSTLSCFAIMPIALSFMEAKVPLPEKLGSVERSIHIDATPGQIWAQIENARDIQPDEVERAWMYRIGVPLPIAGETEQTPTGLVRRITMGKQVYFDQVVVDWQPQRHVQWTYRFYHDSFPPGALDDHVLIGGHYFDLKNTSYTLIPHGRSTELKIKMDYRVSTQFNWYAEPIAKWLIGNFEEVILDFYRQRSIERG